MSMLPVGISGEAQYQISRSLRFNSADSAYLNRTPGSTTDRQKWTWSGWIKRTSLLNAAYQTIFAADSGTNPDRLYFGRSGTSDYLLAASLADTYVLVTTQVFRDPGSWFHLVWAVDTTQATNTDRAKLYVNGVQITAFNSSSYPTLNYDTQFNLSGRPNYIGGRGASNLLDGYLTEINFIDGQALTPSSFGETNPTTGVWQPIKYTGTYGTNGFYLNFSDNSGTTSTTLGKDSSGNGNNWTPSGISVTTDSDSMVDTPTPYGTDTGLGGECRGNYATLNPLDNGGNTVSNGNLVVTTGIGLDLIRSTMFLSSGKWYWEVTCDDCGAGFVGISSAAEGLNTRGAETADSATIRTTTGELRTNAVNSAYGSAVADGNVMMFALDMDAGKFWAGKSGTWFNSGDPAAGTNAGKTGLTVAVSPSISVYDNEDYTANFGQRPFAHTAPSGFKALCTQNLPEPTIKDGGDYFDVVIDTGANIKSASEAVYTHQLAWIKDTDNVNNHQLIDSVRGTSAVLQSNTTAAETTYSTPSGESVAWVWSAPNTGVSNTAGTITSTVSVNTASGFSIVTYTGNGTIGATVGHGLGATPSMFIIKNRGAAESWIVYHLNASASPAAGGLYLAGTNAFTTSIQFWNNTAPTSTVFSLYNNVANNTNTRAYVAYCFAPVAGYSAFGSYTGNGSADGPFVYTGFRPRFIMLKRTDSTGNWNMFDSSRNGYNQTNPLLFANTSDAEYTTAGAFEYDILSNGFKVRNTGTGVNASGATVIFAAFAENPFKYSLAR